MAIRNIRVIGDDILRKKCKEVKEITEKNKELIQDMLDTMYDADGVGPVSYTHLLLIMLN